MKRVRLTLTWLVGLALLVWLLRRLPLAALPQVAARVSPAIWLMAVIGLVLSYALRASRMQLVLVEPHERRGRLLPSWAVWRVMLLHNAAINLLPMRGGELSFPWLAHRELGLPVARAVAALLWMRVQDLGVLALFAALAWPQLAPVWRAGLLILWLAGLLLLRPVAAAVLRALLPGPSAAASPAAGWRQWAWALRSSLEEPSHHHPLTWLCTLGNWAVKLAAGAALLAAACGLAFEMGWAGVVGGELAAILPVQGPAGLGTYEAGVHAGLAWIGGLGQATPPAAVLGALAWHALLILASLVGASLAGFWKLRAQARQARTAGQAPKQGDNPASAPSATPAIRPDS